MQTFRTSAATTVTGNKQAAAETLHHETDALTHPAALTTVISNVATNASNNVTNASAATSLPGCEFSFV